MIKCNNCGCVVGTLEESAELHVIGEMKINLICHKCKSWTSEMLFEYDIERVTYQFEDTEKVTNLIKLGGRR